MKVTAFWDMTPYNLVDVKTGSDGGEHTVFISFPEDETSVNMYRDYNKPHPNVERTS